MSQSSYMSSTLASANPQYLTGAHTKLWKEWGLTNVMPSYNKIYYIKKGSFYFSLNGNSFEAEEGCLVLLPHSSVQTYHANRDDTAEKYWFHFTMLCGEKDLFEQMEVGNVVKVKPEDDKMITSLFEDAIKCEHSNDLSVLYKGKAAILNLVSYYLDSTQSNASVIKSTSSFLKLTEYIEKNIDKKLGIEEMADIMHLSPNYFIRLFRSQFGITPMKYLTDQRLKLASKLLIDRNYSIKEIAIKTGFSTVYYFDRIFKQHTGFTPSQYRMIAINWTEEDEKRKIHKNSKNI